MGKSSGAESSGVSVLQPASSTAARRKEAICTILHFISVSKVFVHDHTDTEIVLLFRRKLVFLYCQSRIDYPGRIPCGSKTLSPLLQIYSHLFRWLFFSVSVCQRTGGFGTHPSGQAGVGNKGRGDYWISIAPIAGVGAVQSFTEGLTSIS